MIYGTHPTLRAESKDAYQTFRDLDLTIETAYRTLGAHVAKFDAIVVTGISGLVVGAPLALKLGLRLVVLRKEGESCHSLCRFIGRNDLDETSRVLFVDDLIAAGTTLRTCEDAVQAEGARITAHYLYEADRFVEVQS